MRVRRAADEALALGAAAVRNRGRCAMRMRRAADEARVPATQCAETCALALGAAAICTCNNATYGVPRHVTDQLRTTTRPRRAPPA